MYKINIKRTSKCQRERGVVLVLNQAQGAYVAVTEWSNLLPNEPDATESEASNRDKSSSCCVGESLALEGARDSETELYTTVSLGNFKLRNKSLKT